MIPSPIVAAFDFDHTLTDRDSLLPFLISMQGWWGASYRLMNLTPHLVRFLIGNLSRQATKECILTQFIGGWSWSELQNLGKTYAEKELNRYLKQEAIKRLRWHQEQGHRCVLVSASLEFYLTPWARAFGFEKVLSSRLELTSEEKVTGKLAGLNCWGAEKKRRLIEYLGPKEERYQLYAYGDSQGDRELLAYADYPFYRVFC